MIDRRSIVFAAVVLASVAIQGETFQSAPIISSKAGHQSKKSTMCLSSKDKEEEFEVQTWNPLRLAVLRLGLTEPAMTSPLNYGKKEGVFNCAYCGKELFDSSSKYDSGSGWPSFWRSIKEGAIDYKMEFDGRLECKCKRCQSHLGHVFLDGPKMSDVEQQLLQESPESDPRGRSENSRLPRFCINGAALKLNQRE
jgi:peptide-methionine (R)-S-oxide reductase